MEAYDAAAWSQLFVAVAGASAALAGLLFVAISINVDDILADPSLPGRAVEALIFLVGLLVVASVCLFPGQAREVLGLEVLVAGLIMWAVPVRIQLTNTRRRPDPGSERRRLRAVMGQLATLPFLVAGVSLLVGEGGGLYWVGAGAVLTFTTAAGAAWVLLIEIKR